MEQLELALESDFSSLGEWVASERGRKAIEQSIEFTDAAARELDKCRQIPEEIWNMRITI